MKCQWHWLTSNNMRIVTKGHSSDINNNKFLLCGKYLRTEGSWLRMYINRMEESLLGGRLEYMSIILLARLWERRTFRRRGWCCLDTVLFYYYHIRSWQWPSSSVYKLLQALFWVCGWLCVTLCLNKLKHSVIHCVIEQSNAYSLLAVAGLYHTATRLHSEQFIFV